MRDPPVKKTLYWCDRCNVPLIGRQCGCGESGRAIPLLPPYDVRPALAADSGLIGTLVQERFGEIALPKVILLNKAGGLDRNELVIVNGSPFGWLSFDPVTREYRFDIVPEGLPFVIGRATRGIVRLETSPDLPDGQWGGRIGGKRFRIETTEPDGTVIVQFRNRFGTGVLHRGNLRVKQIGPVEARLMPDPGWDLVVERNRHHLKNIERNAIRSVRQHLGDRPCANVSFSGGKDSTAVLAIARKAGISSAFFIDTGIEFPETIAFVEAQGVEIIRRGGDFWSAVEKAGPPAKDRRWCCKLLKLNPLKLHLADTGACITIQGNRWYESWNRADLDITSQNPNNPLQLNISPIRNWRALEVFLYLWWQKIPYNPLYDLGLERIGCYLCPAMLESESDRVKELHPKDALKWSGFLERWAKEHGLPAEYSRWGLWRWKDLPPKMRELCRTRGIDLVEKPTGIPQGIVKGHDAMEKHDAKGEPMICDHLRKDFPLVSDIIYLDSAATSISPEPVLAAMLEFERNYRANVGRGVHRLSQIATQRYWHAHEKVARFIGGDTGVTVFCRNTTEAINMVARGLAFRPGDRIVTTILEHHSNYLPWLAKKKLGVDLVTVGINPDFTLDLAALESAVTDTTRLVAVTHVSNSFGVITPVDEIARVCRDHDALLLIDGSQSAPHIPVDVRRIGADFFCFSGHKMLGPTGTGVLWMKEQVIEPSDLGGGMIETVTGDGYTLAEGYQRYEAGTPNIGGGIGLGAAVDYLNAIGMDKIRRCDEVLTARLVEGLRCLDGVTVYAHDDPARHVGVVSFNVTGMHPHEVAHALDEQADIMVRSGHHCCMPLMQRLGLAEGTVRASLYLYSTEFEVDTLIASVKEIAGRA